MHCLHVSMYLREHPSSFSLVRNQGRSTADILHGPVCLQVHDLQVVRELFGLWRVYCPAVDPPSQSGEPSQVRTQRHGKHTNNISDHPQ